MKPRADFSSLSRSLNPFSRNLLLALLASATLAACGGGGATREQDGAPLETRGPISPVDVARVDASTPGGVRLPPELTDPKSILSRRSFFFDLDKYEVRAEDNNLITAHARFLNNNKQFKILIQGNTDERGSREYNLALGQKRADAVKRALLVMGVREDQVESVSLGEEKPRKEGHNEAAWAENRRADILYSGEF